MNKTLKAARRKSGKTQAQVANEAGISEVSFQMYEYGQRLPRVDTAIRIAQAVGCAAEELFPVQSVTQKRQLRNTKNNEKEV